MTPKQDERRTLRNAGSGDIPLFLNDREVATVRTALVRMARRSLKTVLETLEVQGDNPYVRGQNGRLYVLSRAHVKDIDAALVNALADASTRQRRQRIARVLESIRSPLLSD